MNQIEFLLRLAENAQDEGDHLTKEQDRIFSEHTKKLVELSRMIEAAKRNIDLELERFRRWIPQQEQPQLARRPQSEQQQAIPRVITGAGKPVANSG
jgi:hypothetical protein